MDDLRIPITLTVTIKRPTPGRASRDGPIRHPSNGWADQGRTAVERLSHSTTDEKAAGSIVPADAPVTATEPILVGGQYNPKAVLAEQQLIGKLGKALADRYFGPGKQSPAPALSGDPYHPSEVDARIKPRYAPNPAHYPSHPMPEKTLEPSDAEQVYGKAVQGKNSGIHYGVNRDGEIYQFRGDNAAVPTSPRS